MRLITVSLLLWTTMLNAQHQEWQPVIDEITDNKRARTVVVGFYDDGDTSTLVAGSPGSSSSILEIGSISKVFTSLLVQIQVDAGKLDWDQTLADSLPSLEFANDEVGSIRLRELSTHTSGLPRLPSNMSFDDPKDPYAGYDRKLLFEFLTEFDPDALDKSYEYSNLGAGLLGEIAADAAEAGYAEAMQRKVLLPLSMDSTTVGLRDEFTDRLVTGFSDGADMANWSGFDALAGAGALTSSVDDMLTFIENNFGKSAIKSALAAIREPQGDGATGLGWHIRQVGDETLHWHNGGTGGYASFLGMNLHQRKGVIVLSASTDYDGITELGFALMSGNVPEIGVADFSAFEGVYQLSDGFYLTLFEKRGRLHGQATGQGAFPLSQNGEREFRFEAASIVVRFPKGGESPATALQFSQGGSETTAPRVDDALGSLPLDEIEVDARVLQDYVGRYQLAPGAVFTIEVRDGQLHAQLSGQQSLPVFPFEADRFFYKVVDAKLYFERDENNEVRSVTLDQGGLRVAPRIDD